MNLLSKVGSPKELNAAWNKVRKGAKKSSSGLDGDTIYEFGASRESNLKLIANELSSGKFKFTNLKGVPIAKSSTKKRLIASPSIRDRVVQKSIENIITPFIKDKYEIDNESNFGYLEGLGVKDAALAIAKHRRHYPIVLQCDLADFFNTVDKDTLLKSLIYPLLPDTSLNNLLEDLFNLEIGNKAQLKALGKWEAYFPEALNGLPQGVSLSPVFSNIYLNCLDIELPKLGDYKLVRYADDFIVMCKSKESAQNAFKQVEAIVSERLKLTLHPLLAEGEAMERDKKYSIITDFTVGFEFLGLLFRKNKIHPSNQAKKKMITKLKLISGNTQDSFVKKITKTSVQVESWGRTYAFSDINSLQVKELDETLVETVETIVSKAGLKQVNDNHKLIKSLGIPSFQQSTASFHDKQVDKKS